MPHSCYITSVKTKITTNPKPKTNSHSGDTPSLHGSLSESSPSQSPKDQTISAFGFTSGQDRSQENIVLISHNAAKPLHQASRPSPIVANSALPSQEQDHSVSTLTVEHEHLASTSFEAIAPNYGYSSSCFATEDLGFHVKGNISSEDRIQAHTASKKAYLTTSTLPSTRSEWYEK